MIYECISLLINLLDGKDYSLIAKEFFALQYMFKLKPLYYNAHF